MRIVDQKIPIQSLLWYVFVFSVGFTLYLMSMFDIKSLLIIVIAVLGSSPLIYAALKRGSDALSPGVTLPFTYTLYALGPLYVSSQFSKDVIVRYLLFQLLGLVAMRLGLHIATRRKHSSRFYYAVDKQEPRARFLLLSTAIGLLLLSSVSLATYFYAFGGLTGYIKVGYGGQFYLLTREAVIVGAGFEWGLLGSILLVFYGLKRRSKPCLFAGGAIFLFLAFIVLMTGRRRQLLYPFLFGLALFHYGHKKIPSPVIVVGLLLGISIAQYYALARYFLPGGLLYALSQVWPAIVKNLSLIAPWAANEFLMPAASLLEVLQYGGPGQLLGSSYVATLGAPIPFLARLFNQVSFDVNTWRLGTLYPDLLAAGGGLGFSPVTEGYMNFGLIGIIFHLFLYGYVIGKIYARLSSKPSLSTLLLFAGSLPVFMLDGIRVSSASFAYDWMRIYLMPWVIFWLVKILSTRTFKRNVVRNNC